MRLVRAGIDDCEKIWHLQVEAFSELLTKYKDYETNPGNETIERVGLKLAQKTTYFYFIYDENRLVGAIRVVDKKDGTRKKVAPLFILKEFRNKGFATLTFSEIESIHGKNNWELNTILQEKGNCHLYEKLGYVKTGVVKNINDKMDIVYYEKN